ncbi:MAG TPA: hypothetical protein VHK05_04570 [Candidatus Limnocylindrales bacterium]|jgi:hypothetical protein|nr:hypothetical protein [Candidatus Limnocylindrales bacterium]
MAIIGSAFAMIGRFAGRLLNSALGWATLLLFGKVEGRKQTVLQVIALGSLLWMLTVVGILLPDIGTFMLAFVPVPDGVDDGWVRLAMLAAALAIPLLIGAAAIYVTQADQRPTGLGLVTGVLRGYPFTFVLAVTIATLAGVSLARKVRSLAKRREDAHVAVIVKPGGYGRVLDDLQRVLDRSGLPVRVQPAPAIISLPPRLLDAVAGRSIGSLVPDRLMMLNGEELEVLVYPSDVAISGSKTAMARARAAIAVELTESPAYLTTSAESQEIEDAVAKLARRDGERPAPAEWRRQLEELDVRIARLAVPFDEWETVYRQRLQVERELLAAEVETVALNADRSKPEPTLGDRLMAVGTVALIAADAMLLLASLVRPGRRSG